jgi:hypothetical protein
MSDAERCSSELRVTRPEFVLLESRGGQEVSVDPADPDACQIVSLDERDHLLMCDHR